MPVAQIVQHHTPVFSPSTADLGERAVHRPWLYRLFLWVLVGVFLSGCAYKNNALGKVLAIVQVVNAEGKAVKDANVTIRVSANDGREGPAVNAKTDKHGLAVFALIENQLPDPSPPELNGFQAQAQANGCQGNSTGSLEGPKVSIKGLAAALGLSSPIKIKTLSVAIAKMLQLNVPRVFLSTQLSVYAGAAKIVLACPQTGGQPSGGQPGSGTTTQPNITITPSATRTKTGTPTPSPSPTTTPTPTLTSTPTRTPTPSPSASPVTVTPADPFKGITLKVSLSADGTTSFFEVHFKDAALERQRDQYHYEIWALYAGEVELRPGEPCLEGETDFSYTPTRWKARWYHPGCDIDIRVYLIVSSPDKSRSVKFNGPALQPGVLQPTDISSPRGKQP